MNKLTQLLDESYPMNGDISQTEKALLKLLRKSFGEGYNARIAEEKEEKGLSLPTPGYNREDVLATCNRFIKLGQVDAAVNHYRHATGCDFHTAKLSLSIK